VEVPKALLLYKLKVIDVALNELRQEIKETEIAKDHEKVMALMAHLQNVEQAKNEISREIGERIILH